MKKRYHQTKRDRMHESRGMKKHMRHMKKDRMDESEGMHEHEMMRHHAMHGKHIARDYRDSEVYAGPSMRYHQEYDDSMMIREDYNAIANMPQRVEMKPYPMTPYAHSYVPDTIKGVDHQMREDSKMQKHDLYPEKY